MAFITEWNMTVGNFTLPFKTGFTYNLDVDYGDGSAPVHVATYNDANATHNYTVAGTYQISITGTCGAWSINNGTIKSKLTKVIEWGSCGFTGAGLVGAFYGCNNLIQLPAGPITGVGALTNIENFHRGCTGLTSIPAGYFNNFTTLTSSAYRGAFYGCTGLTFIPVDLFRYSVNASSNAFRDTFYGCTGLTGVNAIPVDLFRYNTLLSTYCFYQTWCNCTNLTDLPDGLYRYNTLATTGAFYSTHNSCNKLKFNANLFFLPGEEGTRFLNQSVDFSNCFVRSSFSGEKGAAPPLWNCNFGTGTPIKTNCFQGAGNSFYSLSNYCTIPTTWGATGICPKLWTFVAERTSWTTIKLTAVCNYVVPVEDELKCYFSNSNINLVDPANLVILTTSNNITYEAIVNIADRSNYYAQVDYYINGLNSENLTLSGFFESVDQKPFLRINITDPANHVTLNIPQHSRNHGLLFHNGFIYGSARGLTGTDQLSSLFKLNAADYSLLQQINIYQDKQNSLNQLQDFEQIVYCSGFLWLQSASYLIRINPSDLDYIVFSGLDSANYGQPIGTDGIYLFHSSNVSTYKLNTSLLIGSFASYGYTGVAAVALPANTVLGSCVNIQHHPTAPAYLHSFAVDNQFIYLAFTGSNNTTGYDPDLDIYFYHLQKVNKSTMQTVNDVIIPKCTDDMVQDANYVFLAPEVYEAGLPLFGRDFGLIAIKKTTLEMKYLKALHSSLLDDEPEYRRCFGFFYFNNKIIVENGYGTGTIYIIDTTMVDQWGENFPSGGATDGIYMFEINGVLVSCPLNELVVDNAGMVHVNTWEESTRVFKFNLSQITTAVKTPNIATTLISTGSNSATLNGYIIDEGQSPITSGGFKYGTAPEALTNDLAADPLSYDFTEVLNSLDPDIYYFKAYGTNTEGTFFGNTVMFSIAAVSYNAVSLHNNDTIALLEFLDTHFGCSIRCVQDAPGIATGVTGTVTDQDGNEYDTVVINEKRWMVQNLKTKKYRNGDAIPEVSEAGSWQGLSTGGYCNVI